MGVRKTRLELLRRFVVSASAAPACHLEGPENAGVIIGAGMNKIAGAARRAV
jgi:hypothetical protein